MLRKRYRKIINFFARILVNIFYWELILPRIGFAGLSKRTRSERYRKIAARYRSLAIQMGGVLIKVGQFLSARVDVLPEEVIEELSGLQDEVPPEDFNDIRKVAELDLGAPLLDRFVEFDPLPLAAASLGQAHLARIQVTDQHAEGFNPNDQADHESSNLYSVVVKIQRPNIEKIIYTDLAAVRTVGNWIRRYPPIRKRANIPALIAEFTRVLYEEIDYLAEGRNAETFAQNFRNTPSVLVPKVVWSHTTRKVLTLEDVRGIKITDYESLTKAGIDKTLVAAKLCETYLKQIFIDGFFHADPHPGNLFVRVEESINAEGNPVHGWKLTFIDFGMVGRMKPEIRQGLRELLIGIGLQDPPRVINAYKLLGILLPDADITLLERAESEMFKRFWGKDMDELTNIGMEEIQSIAYEFREILYNMPFQLPQDLIFLGRAIGILSGMCTGLDPKINVFEHLGPFSKKILAEETTHDLNYWLKEAGDIARKAIFLPVRADGLITLLERGEIQIQSPELSNNVKKLEKMVSRAILAILFSTFLLSSIQLFIINQVIIGVIFSVISVVLFVWLIFSR